MGNEIPKQGSQPYSRVVDKGKLNLLMKQIYYTAQLNKDRRKGQQNTREKDLLSLVRNNASKRSTDNEHQKASAIVNDIKWIKALEIIMRYVDILKDNLVMIEMSKGDARKISELIPYVESIIWGCQKCNLDCVKPFQSFIIEAFGPGSYTELSRFLKVTPEIKKCFDVLLPSEKEVKLFLKDLCSRNDISPEVLNEGGHNISDLANLPSSENKSSSGKNNGSNNSDDSGNGTNNAYPPPFPETSSFAVHPQEGSFPSQQFIPSSSETLKYDMGFYQIPNHIPIQGDYPHVNHFQNSAPPYSLQHQPQYSNISNNYCYNPSPNNQVVFNDSPNMTNFSFQNTSDPNQRPFNAPYGNQASNHQTNPTINHPYYGGANSHVSYPKFNATVPTAATSVNPLDELDFRLKNIKQGL